MTASSAADCGCLYFPPDHRLPAKYGLGAAALRYAALGYAVIPLERGGKRPHALLGDRGGIHLASRDPDVIKEWFSLDMAANIGVATGSVNRLAVIDLDVKGGRNGLQSFCLFTQQHGLVVPSGPVARTPSGGYHIWLRVNGAVPERPGILPGVDVKGDGGLVVAPPSMRLAVPLDRSGGTSGEVPVPYEWAAGCPHWLPGAPGWLGAWLRSAPAASTALRQSQDSAAAPPGGVPERGSRNREIYRLACSLYRRHGTGTAGAARVLEEIREVYAKTDKTDFGWAEVLTCLESARRWAQGRSEAEQRLADEFMGWMRSGGWG